LIRQIAREATAEAPPSAVLGCWVSPGWRIGLSVEGFDDWPAADDCDPGHAGIVGALVARRHRPGRVSVCGYLVDTWCLGVKNALGPRLMNERRLPELRERLFAAFDADPVQAPIELVQHLVWGAVDYARTLGYPTTTSGLLGIISNHRRDRAQSGSARTEGRSMSRARMTMPHGTCERSSSRSAGATSHSRCPYLSGFSISREEESRRPVLLTVAGSHSPRSRRLPEGRVGPPRGLTSPPAAWTG
jgi:hypothetical protein